MLGLCGPRHSHPCCAGTAMNNQWTMPTYEPSYFPQMDGDWLISQFNTTLFSGLLCGLLPLVVGIARGRPDWGFRTLGLCFLAGIFKGYWLAAPVALAMTAAGLVGDPRAKAE